MLDCTATGRGKRGRIKESWAKSDLSNLEARTLGSAGYKVERPHRGRAER